MWKFYFLIVVLPEISSTLRAGFKKLHYEAQFLEKILQSWVNFHWHLCPPETLISSVLKDIVRKMSRRLYQLKFNRVKSCFPVLNFLPFPPPRHDLQSTQQTRRPSLRLSNASSVMRPVRSPLQCLSPLFASTEAILTTCSPRPQAQENLQVL